MNKQIIFLGFISTTFFMNISLAAEDSDYFCNMQDIKREKCKKNDVINIPIKQARLLQNYELASKKKISTHHFSCF